MQFDPVSILLLVGTATISKISILFILVKRSKENGSITQDDNFLTLLKATCDTESFITQDDVLTLLRATYVTARVFSVFPISIQALDKVSPWLL